MLGVKLWHLALIFILAVVCGWQLSRRAGAKPAASHASPLAEHFSLEE